MTNGEKVSLKKCPNLKYRPGSFMECGCGSLRLREGESHKHLNMCDKNQDPTVQL